MEILVLIALVIVIVLLLNIQSAQRSATGRHEKQAQQLFQEIHQLKLDMQRSTTANTAQPGNLKKEEQAAAVAEKERHRIATLETFLQQKKEKAEAAVQQSAAEVVIVAETIAPPTAKAKHTPAPQSAESWWERFVKKNPDLEKFIGENLMNKIGIAILVLGIAFFVKYAIDKNWIGEAGRVSIGMGCGLLLIAIAHYLRNSFRAFSSVLAGGGIAVFYFTIAFAFHQYSLIGQSAAFVIMIVITLFAVALALLYDKPELAVIATIGGFSTPFMVSSGQGNFMVLFNYLIILNVGILSLSYYKKWRLLNVLSLFFTIVIYGGWLISQVVQYDKLPSYPLAFLYATVFYLIFLAMNMLYNIRRQQAFLAFDYIALLFINALYYAAGLYILTHWQQGQFKGIFTITLGLINLALAVYFFRSQKGERNLLYLLTGLTLTFISLTAPVQLHGHNITLFWAAEAVLLRWLFGRSQINVFRLASLLVGSLMLISLGIDWMNARHESNSDLVQIFSSPRGIITSFFAAVCLAGYFLLLKKEQAAGMMKDKALLIPTAIATALLLYGNIIFTINYLLRQQPDYILPNLYHRLATTGLILLLVFLLTRVKKMWTGIFILWAAAFAVFFHFVSQGYIINLRNDVLHSQSPAMDMALHWLSVAGLLLLVLLAVRVIRESALAILKTRASWVISLTLVWLLAFEGQHIFVSLGYQADNIVQLRQQYSKAWLTILIGTCSFVLMWLGMRHKYRVLRIVSLSLFAAALLKLFVYDIRNISEGGKIAAFILLGVLLLVVSFMYQKLKKIIIDEIPAP